PACFALKSRTELEVALPGERERKLTAGPPIPTGEIVPAGEGAVVPVPLGRTMLVSRTDFQGRNTAWILGSSDDGGTRRVRLVMDEGWEDILLFAPPDGPSISLEPHTCAPGASSLPEGSPDGLRGLAPGAQLRVRATIRTKTD